MTEVDPRLQSTQMRNQATQSLLNPDGKNKSSLASLLGSNEDPLMQLAAQRNRDTISYTQDLLKQRLVKDLDQTVATTLKAHPNLKGNFFAGIVTDDNYRVEVVPMDTAVSSVSDAAEDEARQVLSNQPIGYFKSADFTLKTPDDPDYKAFRDALNDYFKRNRSVIDYLRNNTDQPQLASS